jgi:ABC-type lipoprotein export system ATPase subunit
MKVTHKVETTFKPTFRSSAVASMFDVPPDEAMSVEWDYEFPIESYPDWQIGLIVGPSGSGKTTLAKHIFGEKSYHNGFDWVGNSVIDDFPQGVSVKDITKALSSVGFSSPPAWLRPYKVLSNGQQFRAEIARLVVDPSKDLVVLDEFTSVVDRQVAKATSAAVERYIRQSDKRFVAVSCHSDIIEWLQPDWVFDVSTGQMVGRGLLQPRPNIELIIKRVSYKSWLLYSGHHYMSKDVHRAAHCYVAFWNDRPVAFNAIMRFPHSAVPNGWRSHRTVVLPDYQGLRIGVEMNDALCYYYCTRKGGRVFGLSTHPGMNSHRRNSPNWMLRRVAGMVGVPGESGKWSSASVGRATEAFEFVGHIRNANGPISDTNPEVRFSKVQITEEGIS